MLRVAELGKSYGAVVAVRGVSLDVAEGAFVSLLGPSGCGKTTTLRCIAGLETPETGRIELAGRTLVDTPAGVWVSPSERGLGMVFQSYAIWPHMTVSDNVSFPLRAAPRRRRPSHSDVARRVRRALEVVRLDDLRDRRATDLSGGQQQRLALARALALEPPLLLLDEPLSNLDARLREDVRLELQRIQRDVGVTTLYVTHDQAEALALSDTIAVMNAGAIEQLGAPRDVYLRPSTRFVATFVGAANLLDGLVAGRDNGTFLVETTCGRLVIPASGQPFGTGARVGIVARPEHVRLSSDGTGTEGRVVATSYLGDTVEHLVEAGGVELRSRARAEVVYQPGARVSVEFDASALTIIPDARATV